MTTNALDKLRAEIDINRRVELYRTLETARRGICAYASDPCDCKYGIKLDPGPGSEATGCPELRDLIVAWTGFGSFNRGQSVEDAANAHRKAAMEKLEAGAG